MGAVPRVLIIEDDILMMDIYATALSAAGCQVLKAWDGEEGLKVTVEQCPAVILLDLVMPKLTGFDVLERLKADEKTRAIPVMVVSNLSDDRSVGSAMSRGADRFLAKTRYTPKEICANVLECLGK